VLQKGTNNKWSLTSLQQRLVKTGSWLVKHVRYYWLLLAEGQLCRMLFGSTLRIIAALPLPGGQRTRRDRESGRSKPSSGDKCQQPGGLEAGNRPHE
jgi:hypothetical protein